MFDYGILRNDMWTMNEQNKNKNTKDNYRTVDVIKVQFLHVNSFLILRLHFGISFTLNVCGFLMGFSFDLFQIKH